MIEPAPVITFSSKPLIFDASALINVISTKYFLKIFEFINTKSFVESTVISEITGNGYSVERDKHISYLLNNSYLEIVDMDQDEASHFIRLISAPLVDALDDGEASTLAVASNRNFLAVIDEKKGIRIAKNEIPPVLCKSTLHLLRWVSTVEHAKGFPIGDAVLNALCDTRMRIPFEFEPWVVDLLTPEEIIRCTSLRKELRKQYTTIS